MFCYIKFKRNVKIYFCYFKEIRSESHDYPHRVAKFPENRNRNRYRDVSPYDHSRVKLQNAENDYINASLVDIEEAQRSYILTQASGMAWNGGLTAIPGVYFRMEQKVCPGFFWQWNGCFRFFCCFVMNGVIMFYSCVYLR